MTPSGNDKSWKTQRNHPLDLTCIYRLRMQPRHLWSTTPHLWRIYVLGFLTKQRKSTLWLLLRVSNTMYLCCQMVLKQVRKPWLSLEFGIPLSFCLGFFLAISENRVWFIYFFSRNWRERHQPLGRTEGSAMFCTCSLSLGAMSRYPAWRPTLCCRHSRCQANVWAWRMQVPRRKNTSYCDELTSAACNKSKLYSLCMYLFCHIVLFVSS